MPPRNRSRIDEYQPTGYNWDEEMIHRQLEYQRQERNLRDDQERRLQLQSFLEERLRADETIRIPETPAELYAPTPMTADRLQDVQSFRDALIRSSGISENLLFGLGASNIQMAGTQNIRTDGTAAVQVPTATRGRSDTEALMRWQDALQRMSQQATVYGDAWWRRVAGANPEWQVVPEPTDYDADHQRYTLRVDPAAVRFDHIAVNANNPRVGGHGIYEARVEPWAPPESPLATVAGEKYYLARGPFGIYIGFGTSQLFWLTLAGCLRTTAFITGIPTAISGHKFEFTPTFAILLTVEGR